MQAIGNEARFGTSVHAGARRRKISDEPRTTVSCFHPHMTITTEHEHTEPE